MKSWEEADHHAYGVNYGCTQHEGLAASGAVGEPPATNRFGGGADDACTRDNGDNCRYLSDTKI